MLFQTKNKVPEVYIKESRDFQLLASILDVAFNYLISNQNKLNYLDDIELVDSKLLDLISIYLGFFTNQYYPENLLRSILINFPEMIRNKGSNKGLTVAVQALQNSYTDITQVSIALSGDKEYILSTDGVLIDQKYIEEVLKYVTPIGAIIDSIHIIQDMNDLTPERFKNEDQILSLNAQKDGNGGSPWFLGQIRNSPELGEGRSNIQNIFLSRVGQTPIVKESVIRYITVKQGEKQ